MITKAALLLFRNQGTDKELLFVRPHNKPYYVFPGGKQEEGETIIQALHRELLEELAVGLTGIKEIGTVTGATPDGRPLEMHLFTAEVVGKPRPESEIAEVEWLTRASATDRAGEMTPITLEKVFPFLEQQQLW
jgi:8-oxo-dGTP diphosphatase